MPTEHYLVDVSGTRVHFMRKPGAGADPVPLILSHGWPWTFWHWSKVIDRLADPAAFGGDPADAFEVIVPSLPGFGYSTPTRPDMNFWKIADVWHELMTQTLGHARYAAAGCDVGALITGQLGHKYAGELYAIHIGSALKLDLFTGDRAWDFSGGTPIPPGLPDSQRRRLVEIERRFAVHLAAHLLAPSTLGYGLADSPAGMLAWLLERWMKWSDNGGDIYTVFARDDLLTHATIYWTGNAIASSIRTYANNNRYPWAPSHDRTPVIEAPTGSGKTLAAFLAGLDALMRKGERGELTDRGCEILYVSPLKALNNDIHRNLQIPLEGVAETARKMGQALPVLEAAVRVPRRDALRPIAVGAPP